MWSTVILRGEVKITEASNSWIYKNSQPARNSGYCNLRALNEKQDRNQYMLKVQLQTSS